MYMESTFSHQICLILKGCVNMDIIKENTQCLFQLKSIFQLIYSDSESYLP